MDRFHQHCDTICSWNPESNIAACPFVFFVWKSIHATTTTCSSQTCCPFCLTMHVHDTDPSCWASMHASTTIRRMPNFLSLMPYYACSWYWPSDPWYTTIESVDWQTAGSACPGPRSALSLVGIDANFAGNQHNFRFWRWMGMDDRVSSTACSQVIKASIKWDKFI
jgi:hypothetical protein